MSTADTSPAVGQGLQEPDGLHIGQPLECSCGLFEFAQCGTRALQQQSSQPPTVPFARRARGGLTSRFVLTQDAVDPLLAPMGGWPQPVNRAPVRGPRALGKVQL